MSYKIKEFADILGVTTDTIRHYEKMGIISPTKEEHSNYRFFTDVDCRNILRSRWYRSFDIPLKESAKLTTDGSLIGIEHAFAQKKEELEQKIQYYQAILDKSEETLQTIDHLKDKIKQCKVVDYAPFYRIRQTDRENLLADKRIKRVVKEWMSLLPYTFYSFEIDTDLIKNTDQGLQGEYDFGLAITQKDAHTIDLKPPSFADYITPQKSVVTYIRHKEGDFVTEKHLRHVKEYLLGNHHEQKGPIYGKILLSETENKDVFNFLEVIVPIK